MFGIGMPEMILICALALIVVGPDKLPELARTVAKTLSELKKTASGLKESIAEEISPALEPVKPELEKAARTLKEDLGRQDHLTSSTEETQTRDLELSTEELIARANQIKDNSQGGR